MPAPAKWQQCLPLGNPFTAQANYLQLVSIRPQAMPTCLQLAVVCLQLRLQLILTHFAAVCRIVCAMQTWLVNYIRLVGGILFFIGGCFFSMAAIHPWLLPSKHEKVCHTVIMHSFMTHHWLCQISCTRHVIVDCCLFQSSKSLSTSPHPSLHHGWFLPPSTSVAQSQHVCKFLLSLD